MHANEFNLHDAATYEMLFNLAEKLGPAYLDALGTQSLRQRRYNMRY